MKMTPKFSVFLPLLFVAGASIGQVTVNANTIKGFFKKKSPPKDTAQTPSTSSAATGQTTAGQTPATAGQVSPASLTSYQNYDFVPGNKILFEDEFTDDQSGEFPTHWNLTGGQAILNMVGPDKAFFLTDGNYVHVAPLMKNKSYLTSSFSVEYTVYGRDGYQGILALYDGGGNSLTVCVKPGSVDF